MAGPALSYCFAAYPSLIWFKAATARLSENVCHTADAKAVHNKRFGALIQ